MTDLLAAGKVSVETVRNFLNSGDPSYSELPLDLRKALNHVNALAEIHLLHKEEEDGRNPSLS